MTQKTYITLIYIAIVIALFLVAYDTSIWLFWSHVVLIVIIVGIRNRTIGYPFFPWKIRDIQESFLKRFSEP